MEKLVSSSLYEYMRGQDPREVMGIGDRYYLKTKIRRNNMGYGEVSTTTTWVLYDVNMNEIAYHRQNSWSKRDKYSNWKEWVKSMDMDPKKVEKIKK